MKKMIRVWRDTSGDAVVEAVILFPIMIMIFTGLTLLAMYLPQRATLQRATQYAATAIATERSDTWLYYSENGMGYGRYASREQLDNVYAALFNALFKNDDPGKAKTIVSNLEKNGILKYPGELQVDCQAVNYIVYKEIVVTASRTIKMPVDLSFIGFPKEIPVTVTSTAVVQNGDEFVRNMDIVVDIVKAVDEKYQLSSSGIFEAIRKVTNKFTGFLDI